MRLNPYLFFNGNCEEAFNVYAKLLAGIELLGRDELQRGADGLCDLLRRLDIVGGDADRADEHGGKIEMMMAHKGSPAEAHVAPEWGDKIMHARLSIGDQVLMASDAPPDRSDGAMKGFSVSLKLDSAAEAERIFEALAQGGTVKMPIQQTFWAIRFGMLVDRFGTPWMVNCEQPA